jgi:CMP-N,N'-diacetyllegionaminic acid synthase
MISFKGNGKTGLIAVVPARGGSKGIHKKNLCEIDSLSLVGWALRAALASKCVDSVILTTDDDEISALGVKEGATVIRRPHFLSGDESSTLSVLQHLLPSLSKHDPFLKGVVLLEPTSPFRPAGVVDTCAEKFFSSNATQTVATVVAVDRNPRYILTSYGDTARFLIEKPELTFTRRQDFTHLKRVNGCVYVYSVASIEAGQLLTDPLRIIEMSSEFSVNIDSIIDLELARLIYRRLSMERRPFAYIIDQDSPQQ